MADIEALINSLDVSGRVKADALAVYALIADAESRVHGRPVTEIHFHEVGTLDAVADVVGVCLLMEQLSPDQVIASPVHTGSGHVHCAHGILPVPAPATALLLEGIPSYGGEIRGELCTPTGAALLKHFVSRFGNRPVMAVEAIGYGMGKKDFEQANCVRAFLGQSEGELETITRLECNLDDMTGEDIAFAMEQLFAAGARDVYTQPIGMKKSRPGILLSVICLAQDADKLAEVMMKHTTTLGIRRQDMSRYVLDRKQETVTTEYGPVRVKHASGMGVDRVKPEYEDIAALAREHNLALEDKPEDMIINSHICRGNYHSTYFTSGPYDSVADYVFARENVNALFLEYDDERSGGFIPLAKVSDDKKVVLGLITTKSPVLEDKQKIIKRIHAAAQYIPLSRLCLSPQCGFASCEIGNKLTEEEQWAKLKLVKEIADEVWGE